MKEKPDASPTATFTAGRCEAARQAVLGMRESDEIGDDAFHQLEEELDWIEMAGGGREETDLKG